MLIFILTGNVVKKRLVPNYTKIKIPNNSPSAKFTQRKTQNLRIEDEIKYLYRKKQQLNHRLYYFHLPLANTWGNTWQYLAIYPVYNRRKVEKKIIQSKYEKILVVF
jgi:hypothetical protein